MFYCFFDHGSPVCVGCSKVAVSVHAKTGQVVVSSMQDDWSWIDVKDIQVIAHPQDCLAWLGLSVDTMGNPPRVIEPPNAEDQPR
jgi:hypothetical protein